MVVTCISEVVKQDIDTWFRKRIKELKELSKLHYGLIGMRKDEWQDEFHQPILDTADFYEQLRVEFAIVPDCEEKGIEHLLGTIHCLPKEVKSDIVPYLRGKAKRYGSEILAEETMRLADTIQNKVPGCTMAGKPSNPWLKRRGYSKEDLITRGNITQVR